jgi:hypothetical protein
MSSAWSSWWSLWPGISACTYERSCRDLLIYGGKNPDIVLASLSWASRGAAKDTALAAWVLAADEAGFIAASTLPVNGGSMGIEMLRK